MKPKRGKSAVKAPKPPFSPPTSRPVLLPALILLAALVFRTVSLTTFGTQVDERITSDVVTGIWQGEWSNNWKYTASAPEFRTDQYNFSSYLYSDALVAGAAANLGAPLPDGSPNFVFWSRL